jgi:hypothetical protein
MYKLDTSHTRHKQRRAHVTVSCKSRVRPQQSWRCCKFTRGYRASGLLPVRFSTFLIFCFCLFPSSCENVGRHILSSVMPVIWWLRLAEDGNGCSFRNVVFFRNSHGKGPESIEFLSYPFVQNVIRNEDWQRAGCILLTIFKWLFSASLHPPAMDHGICIINKDRKSETNILTGVVTNNGCLQMFLKVRSWWVKEAEKLARPLCLSRHGVCH